MFLVTGASGQLGQLVIKQLLNKVPADQIIALVRDPTKSIELQNLGVELRKGDYNDPTSLKDAFIGVKRVLLISSSEIGNRISQHKNVINASKEANVELLVYTSLLKADTSPLFLAKEHLETERILAASGLKYAIARHGWYTENYIASIAPAIVNGAFYGSAGDGKISSATRYDYATADVEILTGEYSESKIYELAGDEAYTLAEFAKNLSDHVNKEIPYINIPEVDYANALVGAGLPKQMADVIADSDTGASKGALFDDSHSLSKLIGRETTVLKQVIQEAL